MNDIETTGHLSELMRQVGEAERTKNCDFLEAILSEDLCFRRANGRMVTKTQYLAELKSPDNSNDVVRSDDIVVHLYPKAALITLRVQMEGRRSGNPIAGTFRNIRILSLNDSGIWQIAMWFNMPE